MIDAAAEIERLKNELAWSVKTALTRQTELDEWRRVSAQHQQRWDQLRQQLLDVHAVLRKYDSADVSPTPAQQAILDDLRYVLKRQ